MSRSTSEKTRLRLEASHPARASCPDCGEALTRCDGDDDAERVFVCVACRTETVTIVTRREASRPRAARHRPLRRVR
jgi:hypothetical protein